MRFRYFFTSGILLLFFLLYLLFPTQNSSVDAWFSAASVKWSGEIFHPHHLLYNVIPWCVQQVILLFHQDSDILAMMKVLNAIYGVIILLLLNLIIRRFGLKESERWVLIVAAGASFALWRFATENETYLLPIVFSMWATYYAAQTLTDPSSKFGLLSGITAAVAILFHEIHIFWWAGLAIWFLGQKKKIFFWYVLPGLMIPLVYFLVWQLFKEHVPETKDFVSFIVYDFQKGLVTMVPGIKNLYLSLINLFRSFFQVHGYMIYLFRNNPDYIFPAVITTFFMLLGFLQRGLFGRRNDRIQRNFGKILLLIVILQWLWAFYSVGNAEFMIMIPVLLSLYIAVTRKFSVPAFLSWGIAMLVWNFFFGIFPAHQYKMNDPEFLAEKIIKDPECIYILDEDQLVSSAIYYRTGIPQHPEILKSPEHFLEAGKDTASLKKIILNAHLNGIPVFTDCVRQPVMIDRGRLLSKGVNRQFFTSYRIEPVDSVRVLQGYRKLYRVYLE